MNKQTKPAHETLTDPNSPVFIREVSARYSGPRRKRVQIKDAHQVKRFLDGIVRDNSREHFVAIFLDASHEVIGFSVIATGTANRTLVHPREIFQLAILTGSCALIVAHNHPSGLLEPSPEDHATTRRIIEAGKLLGIPVLDHIIFSDAGFESFCDRGWLPQVP